MREARRVIEWDRHHICVLSCISIEQVNWSFDSLKKQEDINNYASILR